MSLKPYKTFGILNLSPDSFSDGDINMLQVKRALAKAESLIAAGFAVIDLGAESTRPGAQIIDPALEWQRLEAFLQNYDLALPLSLDSRNAEVIAKALKTNPRLAFVNDVSGMQNPEILRVVAEQAGDGLKFIAMHSYGGVPPQFKASEISDDFYKEYGGLEEHMKKFFAQTINLFKTYGLNLANLILDPGFGFGKNLKHSLEILKIIPKLKQEFGLEILVGPSRKNFLKLWKNNPNLSNEELDQYSLEFILPVLADIDYLRLHKI